MSDRFWESKTVSSRYERRGELGRGGIGTVYLAHDLTLGKLVAIKVLNSDLTSEQLLRFQQEAKISGRLKHQNIVSVLDFGATDTGHPYLIMEYLRGDSLAQIISSGPLELRDALSIFEGICLALQHSHEMGVLHRDLKPENVILATTESGEVSVKVVDFGLARLSEVQDHRLTQTGAMVGSPLYMSPEQCSGSSIRETSDIYSMGCLMFQSLTGSPPFQGGTSVETVMMHKTAEPDSMHGRSGEAFPSEIEKVVATCLKKNPAARYQSFDELKRALDLVPSEGSSSHAREDEQPGSRISPKSLPVIVLLVVILLAVPGAYLFLRPHGEQVTAPKGSKLSKTKSKKRLPGEISSSFLVTVGPQGVEINKQLAIRDDSLAELADKYDKIALLNVSFGELTGSGFRHLTNTKVVELDADYSKITDDGLKYIASLPGLEKVALRDCDLLTNEGLKNLSSSKTLRTVLIGGAKLDENLIKSFWSGPATLIKIQPKRMRITSKGIAYLEGVKGLRQLQFQQCDLDDSIWSALRKNKQLQYLCVSGAATLSKRDLTNIFSVPVPELGLFDVEVRAADLPYVLEANDRLSTCRITSMDSTAAQRQYLFSRLKGPDKRVSREVLSEVFGAGTTNDVKFSELQGFD